MKKLNNKRGFTLIELMIIVIVLGILLGITVPIFAQAQRAMYRLCCTTQQDFLQDKIRQYQMGTMDNMYLEYKIVTDENGNQVIEGLLQKGTYMRWTGGSYNRRKNTWSDSVAHFTQKEMKEYYEELEEKNKEDSEESDSESENTEPVTKDGTKYYLSYYEKRGKIKVAEIPCATEGERFLRYAHNYGWDEKKNIPKLMSDFKLDTYSGDCSINIVYENGGVRVVCTDSFHKRMTLDR